MKVTLEINENELKKVILILTEIRSPMSANESLYVQNNFRVARKLGEKLLRKMKWHIEVIKNHKTIKADEEQQE